MPKNIALFSDGTGNSAAKLFRTNVWRLYDALDRYSPDQIAYYDDGIGTSPFKPYALLAGAFGLGLKRNVQHIYAFLCRNYEPGDRIYAFGFSRGAFTIRVLIGLVHDQGLVRAGTERELWDGIEERWRAHRAKARARITRKLPSSGATAPAAADPGVKFDFVGLWDTVSAYGMPIDELTRAWDQYVWPLSMNDRVPSASIGKAFHALSLDDERNTFHPLLWTEAGADADASAKSVHLGQERISQVWFAGVHANVGGGYPDDVLSHVPLHWIMSEAAGRQLRFRPGELERVGAIASPLGRVYDSRQGLAGYYRYNPRKVARLIADDYHQVSIARPKIHASVFERLRGGDDRYAPIVLPQRYAVVNPDGSIAEADGVPAGGGAQGLLESASQSRARATLQERVWDLVWARRVVYFATLASSAFLALFPLIFKPGIDGVCLSAYFCAVTNLIKAAAVVLPAFVAPWTDAFGSHPGWFLLGVTILTALLFASARLASRIKDGMRLVWTPILAAPMAEAPSARPPSGFVYWLRTRPAYQAFFRGLSRYALPGLFAVAIYVCAAVLLSRIEYSVSSALGLGCTPGAAPLPVTSAVSFPFTPADRCAASGYQLQAGAQYRIWIEIDAETQWSDGGIATDLAGFASAGHGWKMHAGVPFRRWISRPWFKPIARLGARGNDEYALDPLVPFAADERKDRLYTELQARRDGELFLFVNDAVALWPWFHAYGNNRGAATVTIQRVDPPPLPQR